MSQIDYPKLFQTCVLLCGFKGVKTVDPKIVQYAFRILYMGCPEFKTAQSNATKYVTYYMSTEGATIGEFKKATKLKKSLKKYLDTTGQDLYTCDYRISSTVGIYLCGLDDVFDNTHKTQYASLGKKDTAKKGSKSSSAKKQEPTPEDINEDEEEEELIEDEEEEIELDGVEEDEEEEEVKPKAKAKPLPSPTKLTKTTKTTKSKSASV
jgi:hypothetical protein